MCPVSLRLSHREHDLPVDPRVQACGLQVIASPTCALAQKDNGCNVQTLVCANMYATPSSLTARGSQRQPRSAEQIQQGQRRREIRAASVSREIPYTSRTGMICHRQHYFTCARRTGACWRHVAINAVATLRPPVKTGRIPPHAIRTSSCVFTAARSKSPWKPIRGKQILGDKVGVQPVTQAVETQLCSFVEQRQHGCIRQSIHFCRRHTCSSAYSCPHPSASCIKVRGQPTSCLQIPKVALC